MRSSTTSHATAAAEAYLLPQLLRAFFWHGWDFTYEIIRSGGWRTNFSRRSSGRTLKPRLGYGTRIRHGSSTRTSIRNTVMVSLIRTGAHRASGDSSNHTQLIARIPAVA